MTCTAYVTDEYGCHRIPGWHPYSITQRKYAPVAHRNPSCSIVVLMPTPPDELLTEVCTVRMTYTFARELDAIARKMRRKRGDAIRLMLEWSAEHMPELQKKGPHQ